MFELREKGNIKYYVPTSLEETGLVKVGFSTREGGVSEGCYRSMNLRWHCEDSAENVRENYRRISEALGIDYRDVVLSKQVHEDVVYAPKTEDKGNGIIFENRFKSADALITDRADIALCVTAADCTPLFFLDPKKRVVALAHSGWRGTVKRIGAKTVEKMVRDCGSEAEDILAVIGPSIWIECFEVGDEVADEFIKEFGAGVAQRYGEKYHVSMQAAIAQQLRETGVKAEHIEDCGICTYCNSELLFSHRKTNGRRGNLGAFIQLRNGHGEKDG